MSVFRWNKQAQDEDDIEMVDARDVEATASSHNGDSRRSQKRKERRRGFENQPAPPEASASQGPSNESSSRDHVRLEVELTALAERLQEIVQMVTRERETQNSRLNELARTQEKESGRALALESELEQLRLDLEEKEAALGAERESGEQNRRRLEGFEGLKRTMANL